MARDFNDTYRNGNDMSADKYQYGNDLYQLNNDRMTIEQLVDYIQGDLTFSGMLPKVLPDIEIMRIIKENALEWFYKNYTHATMKSLYKLDKEFINSEQYTSLGYIVLPEEIENIVKIYELKNASLFQYGVQYPNISMNFGVTNQPYLTSFVTNIGELATYRQIISAFSDELNKMTKNFTRFSFNPVSKRLNIMDYIQYNFILEVYVRIPQEEIFNNSLFKRYATALSTIRMGEMLGRLNFQLPGNFQYNASDMISQGQTNLDKVLEEIKNQSPNSSFFIISR